MTIRDAANAVKTKTAVLALMTEVTPDENKVYRFDGTEALYEAFTLPGKATVDGDRAQAFQPGAQYTLSEITRYFPAATVTSISPSTGLAAAGGTTVTIIGTNLTGVSSVTFGGTAGTSLTILSPTKLTVVTPAKSAGTYDLVVNDDSGAVTKTNAVTFV